MAHLYIAHRAKRKIAVAFYTIVVRNQAIDAKYPGGMAAFVEKQGPFCNRDIAVCCSMCEEIDEVYQDLVENGLNRREDFAYFDAARETMFMKEDQIIESHVPWMRCAYRGGRTFVWYHDGSKRDDQAIQERLEEIGIDPAAMDPEEYRALQRRLMALAGEIGLEAALATMGKGLPVEA